MTYFTFSFILFLYLGQGPSRRMRLRSKGHHIPCYLVDLRPEVCPVASPRLGNDVQPEMTKLLCVGHGVPQNHFHHDPQAHFSNCINLFWEERLTAGRRIVTLKQSQPPARWRGQLCWSKLCTFSLVYFWTRLTLLRQITKKERQKGHR